jgi:hypothetical protein
MPRSAQRQFHAKNTQTLCALCVFFAPLREKEGEAPSVNERFCEAKKKGTKCTFVASESQRPKIFHAR